MNGIREILRFPKRNVYEFIYPFYIFYKFINMGLFSIDGPIMYGKIKRGILDWFQIFLALGSDIIFFYWSITSTRLITVNSLLNFGNQLFIVSAIVFQTIFHMTNILKFTELWNIYDQIYYFDIEITKLGAPLNINKHFWYVMGGFCIGCVSSFSTVALVIKLKKLTLIQTFLQIAPGAVYCMAMTLYFCNTLLCVLRFKRIDWFLK